MLLDREPNRGPLTYESGALPIAPRGPAWELGHVNFDKESISEKNGEGGGVVYFVDKEPKSVRKKSF